MTDDTTTPPADTADTVPIAAPAQPDAFGMVMALIALATDPREMQGRLAELKAQIDAAEKAQHKIERIREAHDRAVRRDHEEIAKERAELAARFKTLRAAEAEQVVWKERIAEFQYSQRAGELDSHRYEALPGGGVRDFGEGGRWREDTARPLDDPLYANRPAAEPAVEMETVAVAPTASTLTRSIPKRTIRKVANV